MNRKQRRQEREMDASDRARVREWEEQGKAVCGMCWDPIEGQVARELYDGRVGRLVAVPPPADGRYPVLDDESYRCERCGLTEIQVPVKIDYPAEREMVVPVKVLPKPTE